MTFEYDPNKSATNKVKHGVNFEEAQALWSDPWLLEAPTRTDDEPRFLVSCWKPQRGPTMSRASW